MNQIIKLMCLANDSDIYETYYINRKRIMSKKKKNINLVNLSKTNSFGNYLFLQQIKNISKKFPLVKKNKNFPFMC